MSKQQIQLWKQAVAIYKDISELSVAEAINHIDSIHDLSYELKQLLSTTDESNFQADDLDRINFMLVRAKNLSINGKVEQALALINTIESSETGKNNPLAQIKIGLALAKVLYEKSDYQQSIKTLKSLLANSTLPINHTLMLSAKLELGRTYNIIGEHDLALQVFTELEGQYLQILGDNHPDLGGMYKSMASIFRAKGQVDKAREYSQKSYAHNVKTFNNKGIAVAESLNMMAIIAFTVDDDLEQAITLTEKGIKILQESYGENHPSLLELKTNYSFLLSQNQQVDKAFEILNQVHETQVKTLGNNHYSTIETEGGIIGVLIKLKQYDKAKKLALVHLEKVKNLVNTKNIRTASAYLLLARVYLYTKEKQKRLETLLEIERQNLVDKSDPHWVHILRDIARAYHAIGNDEIADKYFHKAMNRNQKIHPETHIAILKTKTQYALFLQATKRLDEARKILAEVKCITKQQNYTDAYLLKTIKKLE